MSYPLYHTLNKDLSKVDFTSKQKKKFLNALTELDDEDMKKALLMLIIEHSNVVDGKKINPDKLVLPYGVKQVEKDVHIDLDKLPISLKWILWKFININKAKGE